MLGQQLRRGLGDGTSSARTGPVQVRGVRGATAVSAGAGFSCAILAGGRVTCWGANPDAVEGKFGPQVVPGILGATALAGNCAILAAGQVSCWGHTEGDGFGPARAVPGVTGARGLTVAMGYACAIVTGGHVRCWGSNRFGALGDGTHTSRSHPVDVVGVTGASSISAIRSHTCAAVAGGRVLCWGRNTDGQLGDGTTQHRSTPVAVATTR